MFRFVPALFVLAGCPSPVDPPKDDGPNEPELARFADATDAQRAAAVQTALGFGPVMGVLAQMQADADARSVDEENQPSGCPSYTVLSEAPLVVRYAASSCTGPSGITWDGTLDAENPMTFDDPTVGEGGMALAFDGFSLDDGALVQRFDGEWSQSDVRPGFDATATFDLRVGVAADEWWIAGGTAITWEDGRQRSVCDAGTVGSVLGLGEFDVACDVLAFGERDGSGTVTLVGEDTLEVDMTPDAEGCLPATVDGEAISPICLGLDGGEPIEEPLDDAIFGGSGLGCVDDVALIDAETLVGEAARVEVRLAAPGSDAVEVHALPAGVAGVEEFDFWQAMLPIDTYVSGESTALTCDEVPVAHVVFVAYDAADAVIGCRLGPSAADPGPIDVSDCPRR